MQRTYSIARYAEVLDRIRERIPGVAVTTDVIVGFPGETEADFEATRAFMSRARFDSAFLFKYSARPDTRAFKLPETVDDAQKGRRLQLLIDEQHAISAEIMDTYLNRTIDVLVEGPSVRGRQDQPPQLYGKSREFKTVVWPDDGTPAGTLQRIKVVGTTSMTLLGEAADAPRPEPLVTIGVS
jgi:tRNA-2-methylthio-N6-dimethylallyladenosine synthase